MTDPNAGNGALLPFTDDPALRDFAIERELGGGGMSRLFVASDRNFERRVVIKVLVPTDVGNLSVERFRREIQVATSLQHPNIVPILSAGELANEPRVPFLVMPFVDGESLRERLLRGPLSIREAVGIARDVARALICAHERGIVHRDIKPGNVLLAAGAAVVSDFGVAKALVSSRRDSPNTSGERQRGWRGANQSLTAIGTSLGTPAYMAPEQAAADPNVDHRADIYALGIVLYEMLAGTPPFYGRSPQELLRAQLADPPPPIHSRRYDVPALLASLIAKCLEKEPDRRPRSAGEVLRWLDDPGIYTGDFARPATTARRLASSRFARRAVIGAGAVAVLASAVAIDRSVGAREPAPPTDDAASTTPAPRRVTIGALRAVGDDMRARLVSEGLASELSNAMASVPGVRVGGTGTDTQPALATPIPGLPPSIEIEGSVQRENASLRVLLRAIDQPVDTLLWSGAFDGHVDSVLALQTRVSRAASSALTSILLSRN